MLQSVLGRENQRLQEADAQQRQKLEAANHRAAELEDQLAKKEQLLVDLKNVLDDAKTQSRSESDSWTPLFDPKTPTLSPVLHWC